VSCRSAARDLVRLVGRLRRVTSAGMPIYEYRCRNGHSFEVIQSMADDPVSTCGQCGAPTERVFHPVAVHFKGSGFYTTDYARKGSAKSADDGASQPDSSSDSKSDSGSGDKKKAEAGSG
jgi:putative FmdB family regulatory protein